jgi:hypothetical protein
MLRAMPATLRLWLIGCLALSPLACGGDDDDGADDGVADDGAEVPCDPAQEPCVLGKTVSTIEVGAGVEDEDVCQSWTLENETELWVTDIKQINGGAYHHANWFFVPDDQYELPDGTWSCSDNDFSELTAALSGGYLFALSTQSREEKQSIPAGGAVRIPPYSRVIGASHMLNASDLPVTTEMRLELTTIPPDDVVASLAPARISYHDLDLQPQARSSFSTDCLVADVHEQVLEAPWEYELYYILSHYHQLGVYTELAIVGGERDGDVIFRHDGFGDNFGQPVDPPLDLAKVGARGLRFTCGFDNPRAESVGWGIGDQEMCVLALQARTNMGWDGDVGRGKGAQVGVTDDGEFQFAGPCTVLGFPWDHAKPGGPER